MLSNITTSYNEKNKRYNFRGFFGVGFRNFLKKQVLSSSKINLLFSKISNTEIEIDSFFLLELREILKNLLNGEYSDTRFINISSLRNLLKDIEEKTWLKETPSNNFKLNTDLIYSKISIDLKEYQSKLFADYEHKKNYLNQRGILVDADTGSGKTLMGITLSIGCEKQVKIFVVPKTALESVWVSSLVKDENGYFKEKLDPNNIYTSLQFDKKEYSGEEYIICHNDALDKLLEVIKKSNITDCSIVIDEIHKYTSKEVVRRKLLLELIEISKCDDVILLSATTIRGSNLEVIAYLELLDYKYTPLVNIRYSKLYGKPNALLKQVMQLRYNELSVKITIEKKPLNYQTLMLKIPNGKDYTLSHVKSKMLEYGKARTAEIKDNLDKYKNTYELLLLKAKSLNTLPESMWNSYRNDFNSVIEIYKKRLLIQYPDLVKRVNAFEKEYIIGKLSGQDKKDFKDASVILKYPSFKVGGEVLGRVFMRMWMECHRDMAKYVDYNFIDNALGKTIVVATHIDTIEAANEKIIKDGFTPVTVYGKESKNISRVIEQFKKDPKANPLTGTYNLIGESHHLIVANTVLAINIPFRPYALEQFVNRINRLGQENSVYALYLSLDTGEDYNINSRNIDILKWCKSVVEEITGHPINNMDLENAVVTNIDVTESSFMEESMFESFDGRIVTSFDSKDSFEEKSIEDFKIDENNNPYRDKVLNKTEYINYAFSNELMSDLTWYRELFGIINKPGNYKYIEIKNNIKYVKMDGVSLMAKASNNRPILKDTDVVKLRLESAISLKEDTYTSIGLVIANYLFLEKALNGKLGYINRPFSHGEICGKMPDLMNKGILTVDEYNSYVNSVSLSLGLNNLFVINATKPMLVAAPGMAEFKNNLIKEYESKHGPKWKDNDIIALKFIADLKKFDNVHIKNDPTYGKLLSGKILNNSRPRKFIAFGVENGFGNNDKPTFVLNSLMDGYPKSKKELTAMFNSARSGSFDRGFGTQEAGYMVKQMQKAVNSLIIKDGDCGDTVGDEILVLESDLWLYKNVYIIEKGIPVFKETLDEYVGKKIKVRSAQFCRNDGSLCSICVGRDAARYNDGISLMVIAAIGVLLGIKMSSMHKASKELIEFNILDTLV